MSAFNSLRSYVRARFFRLNRSAPRNSAEFSEAIRLADEARDKRAWSEAVLHYSEAARLAGSRADVWIQLGHANKEAGFALQALDNYRRAVGLGNLQHEADALLHLGRLEWVTGSPDSAKSTLLSIVSRYPKAAERRVCLDAHLSLAEFAVSSQSWAEACRHNHAALSLDAGRSDIWIQLGHSFKELGQIKHAEFCYLSAAEITPQTPHAWLELGHFYNRERRSSAAIQAFAKAVLADPTQSEPIRELKALSGYSPNELASNLEEAKRAPQKEAWSVKVDIARASATAATSFADGRNIGRLDILHRKLLREAGRSGTHRSGPLLGLDVVIFSNVDWHYRRQRSQHLAAGLARLGARVFYVSPTFSKQSNSQKWRFIDNPYPNIYEVRLCVSAGTASSIHSAFSEEKDCDNLLRSVLSFFDELNIVDAALIVQHPAWCDSILDLEQGPVLFDYMDANSAFPDAPAEWRLLERTLIQIADEVICSSRPLLLESGRKTASLIRNGAETRKFFAASKCKTEDRNRRVVGYFGAVAGWFDVELLEYAASSCEDYDFVVIGEVSTDISSLRNLPNVKFKGEIDYELIPLELSMFDVAIIPFIITELTFATNPVKAYEYLAGGKPVVSTPLPELEELADVISIARTHREFVQCLRSEIDNDNAQRFAYRQRIASENDWNTRAEELAELITKNYPPIVISGCESYERFENIATKAGYAGALYQDNSQTSIAIHTVTDDVQFDFSFGWARRFVRRTSKAEPSDSTGSTK